MRSIQIFPYTWQAEKIRLTVQEHRTNEVKEYEGVSLHYIDICRSICLGIDAYNAISWPAQNVITLSMLKHGKWWSVPNPYRRKL